MLNPAVQVALIGDLVGSRRSTSRTEVQQHLVAALAIANETTTPVQPLAPTIGDEFQGVYADVGSALRASLVVRLALPADVDCRCGIGVGTLEIVGTSEYGHTQDGPAWWAARDAIVEAKRRESGQHKQLRSWFAVSDRGGPAPEGAEAGCRSRQRVPALPGRAREPARRAPAAPGARRPARHQPEGARRERGHLAVGRLAEPPARRAPSRILGATVEPGGGQP